MSTETNNDGWVYTADRKPTGKDGNQFGHVLVSGHDVDGRPNEIAELKHWEVVVKNSDMFYAWRPTIPPIPPRVKTKEQIEQEAIDLIDTIYKKDSTLVYRKDLIKIAMGKGRELERAEWVKKIESKRVYYENESITQTIKVLLDGLLK